MQKVAQQAQTGVAALLRVKLSAADASQGGGGGEATAVERGRDRFLRRCILRREAVHEIDIRIVPEGEFLPAGDKVFFAFRLSARGKETGIEAGQHAFQVWTLREGKGLRAEVFASREDALRAAGLPTDT